MAILAVIGLIAILYLVGKFLVKWGTIIEKVGDQMAMHDASSRRYNVPPVTRSGSEHTEVKVDKELKSIREEIDRLTSGE